MTEEGAYLMKVIRSRCHEEGDCLIWPGAMNAGRSPALTFKGKNVQIRRFIWQQMGKELKPGKAVKVKCRETRCIAEGHMYEGQRGPTIGVPRNAKHRAKMAAMKQAQSTLTMADVEAIRASDKSQKELAQEYGKAKRTIQNILAGNTWKVTTGFFAGLGSRESVSPRGAREGAGA